MFYENGSLCRGASNFHSCVIRWYGKRIVFICGLIGKVIDSWLLGDLASYVLAYE